MSNLSQEHKCFEWVFLFVCFLYFFRATPSAYEISQARGRIGAVASAAGHSHSHSNVLPATYTAAQGNARSLTQCVRPGIEPESSWIWILVGFISAGTQQELFFFFFFFFLRKRSVISERPSIRYKATFALLKQWINSHYFPAAKIFVLNIQK